MKIRVEFHADSNFISRFMIFLEKKIGLEEVPPIDWVYYMILLINTIMNSTYKDILIQRHRFYHLITLKTIGKTWGEKYLQIYNDKCEYSTNWMCQQVSSYSILFFHGLYLSKVKETQFQKSKNL